MNVFNKRILPLLIPSLLFGLNVFSILAFQKNFIQSPVEKLSEFKSENEFLGLKSDILHYNEVVMTSMMAAAYSDYQSWEGRYVGFTNQLTYNLKAWEYIAENPDEKTRLEKIKSLNIELRRNEKRAHNLLKVGNASEGLKILLGEEYRQDNDDFQKLVKETRSPHPESLEPEIYRGKILALNERYTMAVICAVFSGNSLWIERYQNYSEELFELFKAVIAFDPTLEPVLPNPDVMRTLGEYEAKAFALIKENNIESAQSIIGSREYKILRTQYENQVKTLVVSLRQIIVRKIDRDSKNIARSRNFFYIAASFSAFFWGGLFYIWNRRRIQEKRRLEAIRLAEEARLQEALRLKRESEEKKLLTALRILIVDNDPLNIGLMKVLIKKIGSAADFISSKEELLSKIQANNYAIVITNLNQPDLLGLEAAKAIREELKSSIPLLAISSSMDQEEKKLILEAGFNEILKSPVASQSFRNCFLKYGELKHEKKPTV